MTNGFIPVGHNNFWVVYESVDTDMECIHGYMMVLPKSMKQIVTDSATLRVLTVDHNKRAIEVETVK